MTPAAMLKTSSLLYVAILLAAFVVGLLGTLAAGRAVARNLPRQAPRLDRPAATPTPVAHLRAQDC